MKITVVEQRRKGCRIAVKLEFVRNNTVLIQRSATSGPPTLLLASSRCFSSGSLEAIV